MAPMTVTTWGCAMAPMSVTIVLTAPKSVGSMSARRDKRISRPSGVSLSGHIRPVHSAARVGACSELSPECAHLKGIPMKLIPKNWKTFQHYKDRCPPWIKLHRDLLNNYDYAQLSLEAKAIAPLMWLLASESKDGVIDLASEALAFRLHVDSNVLADGLKSLIDKGFFMDASNMLAECYQDAIPETETDIETERESEAETKKETDISLPSYIGKLSTVPDWVMKLKHRELSGEVLSIHNKRLLKEFFKEEGDNQ